MISVYDELCKLQKLPCAYEEWSDYRNNLTDFICNETKKGSTALIVGAGECNDFDLNKLVKHFSAITLMDHNLGSISEGLNRQGVSLISLEEGNAEISLSAGDILGIDEDIYRNLCSKAIELIKARSNAKTIEKLFLDTMKQAYENRKPYTFSGKYDHVICCGVHSQLNNMFCQIAEVFHHYTEFSMENIFRKASLENNIISRELNSQMIKCAACSTILAVETQRIGVNGAVEGAYQALQDLDSHYRIAKDKNIIWPFDEKNGKVYRMRVLSVY